jgi:clan AA aspartic protease (TIGR02281 family)
MIRIGFGSGVRNIREEERPNTFKKVFGWFLLAGIPVGLLIESSYLAFLMGEGLLHMSMTLILLGLVPVAGIYLSLGQRRNRIMTALALNGGLSWAICTFLVLGAYEKTLDVVTDHGAWFMSLGGKSKRDAGNAFVKKVVEAAPKQNAIPYEYANGSIIIEGLIKRNGSSVPVRFILDTGASITTISVETARKLGIGAGGDGASLDVQTAGGGTSYPVAILDSITIGDHSIGPVSVALCDPCAAQGTVGLLGMNFTSNFHMTINNKQAKIRLTPVDKWVDRKQEIEPFIEVSGLGGALGKERLIISANVTNLSPLALSDLVFECKVLDGQGRTVDTHREGLNMLKSREMKKIEISMPPHSNVSNFKWELQRAFWADSKTPKE